MINKKILSWIVPVIVLALVSCKKNGAEEEKEAVAVPVEHGTLTGVPTKKSIGPAGGTIMTPDGNISIEIPAGAVTTATEFSIQPVTSTLDATTGTTYRLGPEKVEFSKDVKISFRYQDSTLDGASEDEIYLAYQDAEGYWNREVMTEIDKQNKSLFINTKHFSDWAIERKIWIKNTDKAILAAGEQTSFIAYYSDVDKNSKIDPVRREVREANIDGWYLNGSGSLSKTTGPNTTFTAPGQIVNPEIVTVGVSIKNLVGKKHPNRPGNSGLVIVQKVLQLVGEEYFVWEWDGVPNTAFSVDALNSGGNVLLMGTGLNGAIQVTVNGTNTGFFEEGDVSQPEFFNLQVNVSRQQIVIYRGFYFKCNQSTPQYGKGMMALQKFGAVGKPVEGEFEAIVYELGNSCQPTPKTVTGYFKIKRKA